MHFRISTVMRLAVMLLGAIIFPLTAAAVGSRDSIAYSHPKDSLRISLITCSPGGEIFELYGHAAMRVSGIKEGQRLDRVYNYGMFDFNSPGFIFRFVKGETDYYAGAMPTSYFVYSYIDRGSQVTEYPLNLTSEEAAALLSTLDHDVQPENATYRYKYFSNNCSTRLLDAVDAALGSPAAYPAATDSTLTCRELLMQYNAGYPWYQLGIDIALGSEIDRPMTARGRMFNPMELSAATQSVRRPDGTPLFGTANLLAEARGETRLPPTPWYLSPLFIFWTLSLIVDALVIYARRKHLYFRWLFAAWGLVFGLAGSLVWFLAFISVHEATSPNPLIWWLNPLWLLLPVLIWFKRTRNFCNNLMGLQAFIALIFLCTLPFSDYSLNPALLPLLLTTILFGCELKITIRRKQD